MIDLKITVSQPAGIKSPGLWGRRVEAEIKPRFRTLLSGVIANLKGISRVASGEMKNSWDSIGPHQTGTEYSGEVVNYVIQSAVMETGARFPRGVSREGIDNIAAWVQNTMGVHVSDPVAATRTAFGIAKNLKKRGLPSSHNKIRLGAFNRFINGYIQTWVETDVRAAMQAVMATWGVMV